VTLPPLARIARRDTHRLIPAKFLDEPSAFTRIAEDGDHLEAILELDNATNERLLAQHGLLPEIGPEELVFGIPNATVINAAFTHPHPHGSRFNGPHRGAWYGGFELETSQAEVAYHKSLAYLEIHWNEPEETRYQDLLADFTSEFHDCRGGGFGDVLEPDSYVASQRLAASLLATGSAGVVYPSVRRPGGTCLACFRPALVNNVRRGKEIDFQWQGRAKEAGWQFSLD